MGNRQYIGARYVPQFFDNNGSNEWVSGIAYNALTIVTYLNNSYTSKKYVPSSVGSPNANPEYWVCTGNITGAVEQLESRMNDAENAITLLNNSTETLDNRIDKLEEYNQYLPTKILCIGDSYGAQTNSWCTQLKSLMGLSDTQFTNECVGSSGFIGNTGITTFGEQLAIPTDKSSYTHIIIMGGFNDAYDSNGDAADFTALKNAISDCDTYIKANYPNAKVYIGFCATATNIGNTVNASKMRKQFIGIRDIYNWTGSSFGWSVIRTVNYALHSYEKIDSTDLTYGVAFHPNLDGAIILAQCVYTHLNGGINSFENYDTIEFTKDNTYVSSANITLTEEIANENCFISGEITDIRLTSAIATENLIKIGSVSHKFVYPNDNYYLTAPIFGFCNVTPTDNMCGQILFTGNDVYLYVKSKSNTSVSAVSCFAFRVQTSSLIN